MTPEKLNVIVELSQRVAAARVQLEAAEKALETALSSGAGGGTRAYGASAVTRATSTVAAPASPSAPVSERVRKLLSTGTPMTFGDIERGVLELGPATKFAVRSAVQGERQKGRATFDGTHYRGTPDAKSPRRGRPPAGAVKKVA